MTRGDRSRPANRNRLASSSWAIGGDLYWIVAECQTAAQNLDGERQKRKSAKVRSLRPTAKQRTPLGGRIAKAVQQQKSVLLFAVT